MFLGIEAFPIKIKMTINIELDKKEYDHVTDALELMSNEQLDDLFTEVEDLLITRGVYTFGMLGVPEPKVKGKGKQTNLEQFDKKFDLQKDGYSYYNRGYYGGYGYNKSKTVWTKKEKLEDITKLCKKIWLRFSKEDTAKLYTMMLNKPSIEWGAYLLFNEKLPSLNDVWIEKDENEELIIDIAKMVNVPQKATSGHVDYREQDYPELMQEVYQARARGMKTTGRIHSHHNMSAWHSGTDWDEFDKYLPIGDHYLSIVVATNKKFNSELVLDKRNTDIFFQNLQFHVAYGIPDKDAESELGYKIICSVMLDQVDDNKLYKKADKYLVEYEEYLDTIAKTEKVYNIVKVLVDKDQLSEEEERELRTKLLEDELFFKSFEVLGNVTHETIKTSKDNTSELEKFKKEYIDLGVKLGLVTRK